MAIFSRIFGGSKDNAPLGDRLDDWIEATLRRELQLDEIGRDEDGDIPVRWGSALVFIRAIDVDSELPLVRVFAPLLEDIELRSDVYEAVNSINLQVPFAKAIVDPETRQIVLAADLFVFEHLSPEQVISTIELIGENADHFDTMLQKRFGGTTVFDDEDEDEFDV